MGQRNRHAEFEVAGSDSFLDVIANIVGILIILIVVVGVKVGMSPVHPDEVQSATQSGNDESVAETDPDDAGIHSRRHAPVAEHPQTDSLVGMKNAEDEPPLLPVPTPDAMSKDDAPDDEPPQPREPSAELISEAERLRRAIAALEAEESKVEEALSEAQSKQEAVSEDLVEADETLKNAAAVNAELAQTVEGLTLSVNDIAQRLVAARRQFDEVNKNRPPAEKIKHKVTPISRAVKGGELHFHLSKGRVVPVPLDELQERLLSQVKRQKEWLSKFRKHQGEVGPVGGFTMQYVVERQEVSAVEELRDGSNMMRIGVSQWQLVPAPDLEGETAAQALKPRSAFLRALRQAKPETTLTFWVYPDSFALCRALTQFAHEDGYTVAARPLPAGMPIAGSPSGSRSAGQ